MILLSQRFMHEKTGLIFELIFDEDKKKIAVETRNGDDHFIFNHSKPSTLVEIGGALREIGEFCELKSK